MPIEDKKEYCATYNPDETDQLKVLLKLIRLVRLQRIFNIFDFSRINKLVDTLFSGQTRSKKVVFQLIMKNIYRVFRLILLTVLITYFTGALFFFVSELNSTKELKAAKGDFRSRFELDQQDGIY